MTVQLPPDWKNLAHLDEPELLTCLAALDDCGFIMTNGESLEHFAGRIDACLKAPETFTADPELADLLKNADAIPAEIRHEAAQLLQKTFGFTPTWIPAAFSSRHTGRFSAGVMLEIDNAIPVIFLNNAFKNASKYAGYDRTSTLAHEMLHAIRMPLSSKAYDEFFPWQLSPSPARRTIGNFFRDWRIPTLFFLGITIAAASLAGMHQMLWAILLPLAVILRECQLRWRLRRASQHLMDAGFAPTPVLTRIDDDEIAFFARASRHQLEQLFTSSPRWKMLAGKFQSTR